MLRAKPTKLDITRADVEELDRVRKKHEHERKQARFMRKGDRSLRVRDTPDRFARK